jgi:hypothetical protein
MPPNLSSLPQAEIELLEVYLLFMVDLVPLIPENTSIRTAG